jgi:hypothetical protein
MKNQNFSMSSGDDVDIVVTVRAADRCTLLNVAGVTPLWVLAESPGCTPLVSKTGSVTDAAGGEITVSLEPGDTDRYCGTYHHELQLTDAQGRISTVMTGKARITGDSAP